jgi:hypothetical protein
VCIAAIAAAPAPAASTAAAAAAATSQHGYCPDLLLLCVLLLTQQLMALAPAVGYMHFLTCKRLKPRHATHTLCAQKYPAAVSAAAAVAALLLLECLHVLEKRETFGGRMQIIMRCRMPC